MSHWIPTPEQLERITGASVLAARPPVAVVYDSADPIYRNTGGVSQSFLKAMRPTPAHACAYFSQEDAKHFRIGRHVHQALLTPHDPLPAFVVIPDEVDGEKWHGNKKVCKAWAAKHEAAGKVVMAKAEWEETMGTIRSLAANPDVDRLLRCGRAEVSLYAKTEILGIEFMEKARIDWAPQSGDALVDIKTVRRGESDPLSFAKKIKWEGYGFQAAFYLDLWNRCNPEDERERFVWVVVEKEAPYVVSLYYATSNDLVAYFNEVNAALETFADCVGRGVFPGDVEGVRRIAV